MSPQFFPVDYDPWADPEDTASARLLGFADFLVRNNSHGSAVYPSGL